MRLRSIWRFVQRRFPGLAARIRAWRAARRRGSTSSVEARLRQLEEDVELMSRHVAALTAQLGYGESVSPADAEVETRVNAARLSAIAFYESRIAALEESRDE